MPPPPSLYDVADEPDKRPLHACRPPHETTRPTPSFPEGNRRATQKEPVFSRSSRSNRQRQPLSAGLRKRVASPPRPLPYPPDCRHPSAPARYTPDTLSCFPFSWTGRQKAKQEYPSHECSDRQALKRIISPDVHSPPWLVRRILSQSSHLATLYFSKTYHYSSLVLFSYPDSFVQLLFYD